MRKKIGLQWLLACMVAGSCFAVLPNSPVQAFSDRNLSYGCIGYSVYELQNRLKYLGYYHGPINGIFTWDVYWAVRDFQYAFGMQPTGYVNMATKIQLVKATQGWHYVGPLPHGMEELPDGQIVPNPQNGQSNAESVASGQSVPANSDVVTGAAVSNSGTSALTPADIDLMAHVVHAEAKGEPLLGQVGVADVILNRLKDPKFPQSIPGIIYQPGAFQCVSNGTINEPYNAESLQAVMDAIHGWDPVGSALYYFNPATSTSPWIWGKPEITKIGNQIFSQ